MKHIYLLAITFILSTAGHSQISDLALDTAYHKSNVGGYIEEGLTYSKDIIFSYSSHPIELNAVIKNTGTLGQTNCHVIMQANSIEFSSDTVDLAAGDTYTLTTQVNGDFFFR